MICFKLYLRSLRNYKSFLIAFFPAFLSAFQKKRFPILRKCLRYSLSEVRTPFFLVLIFSIHYNRNHQNAQIHHQYHHHLQIHHLTCQQQILFQVPLLVFLQQLILSEVNRLYFR